MLPRWGSAWAGEARREERLRSAGHPEEVLVKKLLLLVIVVALGAALAKKVRTA